MFKLLISVCVGIQGVLLLTGIISLPLVNLAVIVIGAVLFALGSYFTAKILIPHVQNFFNVVRPNDETVNPCFLGGVQ